MPTSPVERPRLITSPPPVIKAPTVTAPFTPSGIPVALSSELILEQEEVKTFKTGFKEAFPRTWWAAFLILGSCLINPGIGVILGFIGAIVALFVFSSSNKVVLLGRWLGAGILPTVALFVGFTLYFSLINPTVTTEVIEDTSVAPVTSTEEIYQEPAPEAAPPVVVEEPAPVPVAPPVPEPAPAPVEPVPVAPVTDPRFKTCTEAIANGYGNYERNDIEYTWYEDRDNDGTACEK